MKQLFLGAALVTAGLLIGLAYTATVLEKCSLPTAVTLTHVIQLPRIGGLNCKTNEVGEP